MKIIKYGIIEDQIEKLLDQITREVADKNLDSEIGKKNRELVRFYYEEILSPSGCFVSAFQKIVKAAGEETHPFREPLQNFLNSVPDHVYKLCIFLNDLKNFERFEPKTTEVENKLTEYQLVIHTLEEILSEYLLKNDREKRKGFSAFKELWEQTTNRLQLLDNIKQEALEEIKKEMEPELRKLHPSHLITISNKAAIRVGKFGYNAGQAGYKLTSNSNTSRSEQLVEYTPPNPN